MNVLQNGPCEKTQLNGQPVMLDKFNTNTFAQESTSVTGSRVVQKQTSPRIAILGPATFSSEAHSTRDRPTMVNDEPTSTVSKQITCIYVSRSHPIVFRKK